jgi:hypothetical protein
MVRFYKYTPAFFINFIFLDAQSVVDIYVNYDCDFNAANIFKRLIDALSKFAQVYYYLFANCLFYLCSQGGFLADASHSAPSSSSSQTSPHIQQSRVMRLQALDCLVGILICMRDWSSELYLPPTKPLDDLGLHAVYSSFVFHCFNTHFRTFEHTN